MFYTVYYAKNNLYRDKEVQTFSVYQNAIEFLKLYHGYIIKTYDDGSNDLIVVYNYYPSTAELSRIKQDIGYNPDLKPLLAFNKHANEIPEIPGYRFKNPNEIKPNDVFLYMKDHVKSIEVLSESNTKMNMRVLCTDNSNNPIKANTILNKNNYYLTKVKEI